MVGREKKSTVIIFKIADLNLWVVGNMPMNGCQILQKYILILPTTRNITYKVTWGNWAQYNSGDSGN